MDEENHELLLPLVQEENICLPLPINVVSKYWNIDLPIAEAVETSKQYSGFNGSVLIEGIESAERHGLNCKILRSSLQELKKIIVAGVPTIVILPGIPEITQHASVITGFNEEEKTIFHYVQQGTTEGEQQEGAIPQDVFDKEWSEEGRILIVLAPNDIMSSISFENENSNQSNRLCFDSERNMILKNQEEALASLKKAIELDSKNSNAFYQLGALLNEQNSTECIKYYEECLKINNRSYLSLNGLGNFHLKTNQFEKARDFYSKAIELDSKRSAKIYKNRAYLLDKLGKSSDAKTDLQNYLKYFPKAPDRGVIEQAIREL
ncbi:MAG: tetratricopeptide repeat protein [Nitrosopumilus sp. (ex Thoosa mismalolli)]|nr:tetratricopeptide repeat protein [Nitrosopumilus sp. (ex Thoosa mismalolli)]